MCKRKILYFYEQYMIYFIDLRQRNDRAVCIPALQDERA